MKKSHAVTVLGRALSVKSSAPPERVQEIESFVNSRLQEIGGALKSGDAQLVLMLALLNTAEELLEIRAAHTEDEILGDRVRNIIGTLEKT